MFDPVCIGLDVSRSELVVARATTNSERAALERVPNSAAAIERWLGALPAGCRIGMEATGAYHRLVADMAHACGHTVFVFNPRDVSLYLRSLRTRGKTDVLDARGIARFVRNESAQCHPYVPPTPTQQRIATLINRRHQVVKQRASVRMSFSDTRECAPQVKALIQAFTTLIAKLDAQIKAAIAQDAALESQRRRLMSIPGIGPLIGAALCMRMSRVDYANSDALVAAIGLDPRPVQSGQYDGVRRLSKRGNAEERRLIYMAALSACRHALWRSMRDRLLDKGLPSTAAYCVIARKILRVALAVWKNQTTYDANLIGNACV